MQAVYVLLFICINTTFNTIVESQVEVFKNQKQCQDSVVLNKEKFKKQCNEDLKIACQLKEVHSK